MGLVASRVDRSDCPPTFPCWYTEKPPQTRPIRPSPIRMIPSIFIGLAYFSNTFSIWPTFFWMVPATFSALAFGGQIGIIRNLPGRSLWPCPSTRVACLGSDPWCSVSLSVSCLGFSNPVPSFLGQSQAVPHLGFAQHVFRAGSSKALLSSARLAGLEIRPDRATSPDSSPDKAANAEAAVLPPRSRWAPCRRRILDTGGPPSAGSRGVTAGS